MDAYIIYNRSGKLKTGVRIPPPVQKRKKKMATGSNTLTSHHGESNASRADKMSGWITRYKKSDRGARGKMSKAKKIAARKRRMFLKNPTNWEKI